MERHRLPRERRRGVRLAGWKGAGRRGRAGIGEVELLGCDGEQDARPDS